MSCGHPNIATAIWWIRAQKHAIPQRAYSEGKTRNNSSKGEHADYVELGEERSEHEDWKLEHRRCTNKWRQPFVFSKCVCLFSPAHEVSLLGGISKLCLQSRECYWSSTHRARFDRFSLAQARKELIANCGNLCILYTQILAHRISTTPIAATGRRRCIVQCTVNSTQYVTAGSVAQALLLSIRQCYTYQMCTT